MFFLLSFYPVMHFVFEGEHFLINVNKPDIVSVLFIYLLELFMIHIISSKNMSSSLTVVLFW